MLSTISCFYYQTQALLTFDTENSQRKINTFAVEIKTFIQQKSFQPRKLQQLATPVTRCKTTVNTS